jgi:hypothetical protein
LELLTAPKTLSTFLLGGVALGVLGNAVYQLLTNWLSTDNSAAVRIIIGAILALAAVRWLLHRLTQRIRVAPPLPNKQAPTPRRGLICLVSANEPTIRKALAWHAGTLQWCRLLCSEQSMPLAQKLRDELQGQRKEVELVFIHDVFDPVECRNIVDSIYANLPVGLSESEVILDFTGMTSIASVGAVLACLHEQRSIQYTPAMYDKALQAQQPRDPSEIVLNWNSVPELAAARMPVLP